MEGLLNAQAEGRAKGLAKWYALAHATRCSGCRKFLNYLEEYLARAKDAREVEADEATLARLSSGSWRQEERKEQ